MRTTWHKQIMMFVMLHNTGRNDLHFSLTFSLMSRTATGNEEQLGLNLFQEMSESMQETEKI